MHVTDAMGSSMYLRVDLDEASFDASVSVAWSQTSGPAVVLEPLGDRSVRIGFPAATNSTEVTIIATITDTLGQEIVMKKLQVFAETSP